MTLKDISFSGFFKLFFVVQTFLFMATSAILFAVYFINPDKVKLEPFKIANMITLDLDGANNFPIVFLFVGLFNLVISVTFSALITVILTKIPFIGRIKIAPILYNENVFD